MATGADGPPRASLSNAIVLKPRFKIPAPAGIRSETSEGRSASGLKLPMTCPLTETYSVIRAGGSTSRVRA